MRLISNIIHQFEIKILSFFCNPFIYTFLKKSLVVRKFIKKSNWTIDFLDKLRPNPFLAAIYESNLGIVLALIMGNIIFLFENIINVVLLLDKTNTDTGNIVIGCDQNWYQHWIGDLYRSKLIPILGIEDWYQSKLIPILEIGIGFVLKPLPHIGDRDLFQ